MLEGELLTGRSRKESSDFWRQQRPPAIIFVLLLLGATLAAVLTSWHYNPSPPQARSSDKSRELASGVNLEPARTHSSMRSPVVTLIFMATPAPSFSPQPSISSSPSRIPTREPSLKPTSSPTTQPSPSPTIRPTVETPNPTRKPTPKTTGKPTRTPTVPPTQSLRQDTSQLFGPTPVPTMAPTACIANRTVEEDRFYIFFEQFDISIASDQLLEIAVRQTYNNHTDLAGCDPLLMSVSRIPDDVSIVTQGQSKQEYAANLLILTERVEFKAFSQQVNSSGLFPTPVLRGVFVSALNEFFSMRQMPVYALGVKEIPPPTPAPTGSPTTRPPTTPQPSLQPTMYPTVASPTDVAAVGPTELPTEQPTTTPTAVPTGPPTDGPTPGPSSGPPTVPPTVSPTNPPTRVFAIPGVPMSPQSLPRSTWPPTFSPSEAPSLAAPTLSPESWPRNTWPPTFSPSGGPSDEPTSPLSPPPTVGPTWGPTPPPTFVPTKAPSIPPTWKPSPVPSNAPTDSPTWKPSPVPSDAPTGSPSREPTSHRAEIPSEDASESSESEDSSLAMTPTTTPSSIPTLERPVSAKPTLSPNAAPFVNPSRPPSSQPSFPPEFSLREPELKSVRMVLQGVPILPSRSQFVWREATEAAIRDEVISILNNQVESVAVKVSILSQSPGQFSAATSQESSLRKRTPNRLLQQEPTSSSTTTLISSDLTILFDVQFFIRAVIEDHNTRRYVGAALDTPGDENIFIMQLKSSGEAAFEDLYSVRLVLPPESTNAIMTEDDAETLATGMTVGITLVSVTGAALIAVGLYMWTKRRPDRSLSLPSSEQIGNLAEFDENDLAFDVMEKPEVEVSTLGDPIPQGAAAPMDASIAEESGSLPYDYKVESHKLPQLDESGDESGSYSFSEVSSNSLDVQTDDDTLDAQYFIEDRIEVEVPPGLLGLVLEEDSEGIATVYDMKELSPLAGRIHIGDKLVSVDKIDVSAMPVHSVMKLIASKQSNSVRRLVFNRPSKKLAKR